MNGESSTRKRDRSWERNDSSPTPVVQNTTLLQNGHDRSPTKEQLQQPVPQQKTKATTYWGLINGPVHKIYKRLNPRDVGPLLTSIRNATKENVIFIPNSACSSLEYASWEEKYSAFTTWLLGRLFYILGCENLANFHDISVECQVKILRLLASQRPHMFQPIAEEYLLCLQEIVDTQKSDSVLKLPIKLERFISKVTSIDDDDLDLNQVFVNLTNDKHCAQLQAYIVEILSNVLDALLEFLPHMAERVWCLICELLENAPLSIKTKVLKVSAAMLLKAGFCMHFDTRRKYLSCLHVIIERDPFYAETAPKRISQRKDLLSAIEDIFQAINKLHSTSSSRDDTLLFTILAEILQGIKIKDSSDQLLNTAGILAEKLLVSTSNPAEEKVITRLINNLGKCKFGIHIVEFSVLSELRASTIYKTDSVDHTLNEQVTVTEFKVPLNVENNVDKKSAKCVLITCRKHSATWKLLWTHLKSHFTSLTAAFQQQNTDLIDSLEVIQTIITCATRVHLSLLENADNMTFDFEIDLHATLKMFTSILLFTDPTDGSDCVRLVLEIVGDLLWMPGMSSQPPHLLHTAVALLALPWIGSNPWSDLKTLNNDYIQTIAHRLKSKFAEPELQKFCLTHLTYPICRLPLSWPLNLINSCIKRTDGQLGAVAMQAVIKLMCSNKYNLSLIVDNILLPAVDSEQRDVQIALSETIILLICLLAGSVECVRIMKDDHIRIQVRCLECDVEKPSSIASRRKQILVDEKILKIFLRLLTSSVPEVRRNVAAALPRLSNHVMQFRDLRSQMPHKWIPFLKDDDQRVRLCFSKVVKFLVFNRRWMEEKKTKSETLREEHIPLSQYDRRELSESVPLLDNLNEMLLSSIQESLRKKDKLLQESLLATLNEIGCVPVDCVLLPTISMAMLLIGYPSSSMAAAAKVCVGAIAAAHNCTPRDLYVRYKKELCYLFVDIAVFNHIHAGYNFSTSLHFMARALGLVGSREFIANDARTFLPHLIPSLVKHPDAEPLLQDIAAVTNITVSELIEDNFPYIYPHVYLYEDQQIIDQCCSFMERLSQMSIKEQKRLSLKVMSNELILHYHARTVRVISGLVELIKEDPNFKPAQPNKPRTELIADFLYPQFLGILVSFDSKLVTKVVCESVKRQALLTLPGLIELMGVKYITTVRLKVLATLRSALRLDYSNFPELNCKAWDSFVNNVEISALGPLLSTIFVSLMPLLKQFPREISAIFRFLVIRNEDWLEDHFDELYFVPYHPAIDPVYRRIQASIEKNTPSSFKGSIQDMLKFVSHENIDVRLFGLRRLKSYLKNQDLLQKAICPYDTVEPEVIELMNTLISGCKDTDVDVRLECGECLGEIGAIDPGIMPWRISPPSKDSFPLCVTDDMFGIQALVQLCKGYQSSRETQNMDSFSLAIQELLKAYQISSDSHSVKNVLWEKFPPHMQEIMIPLFTSCYKSITGLKKNWPAIIYGSSYCTSMSEWACCWASKLIASINNQLVQTIFSACVFSFKRDLETLQFFLPYILLHALMNATEVVLQNIVDEIEAVMKDDRKTTVDPNDPPPLPIWTPSFSGFPRANSSDSEKHVKIANTVYSLIDFLYRWAREFKAVHYRLQGIKYDPCKDEKYANVHGFLVRISLLSIAAGNYETHNYQRALIYLEEYVRAEGPETLQKELCFFAKVYARLDNPDMVAAVMALRTQEPSLEEMILAHEVTGQLQDAAACYERLADEEGLGPGFLRGMVQCYLGLDQPFTSLKIAEGIVSERPDLAPTMHEVEADTFWRMQMFDELGELLRLPELRDSKAWGVSVGKGMVAMKAKEATALKIHLTDARKSLIHSLGVASLEEAAYQQGYQHIVRLHMLNEFEKAEQLVHSVLLNKKQLSHCKRQTELLLSEWDNRLEFVQPSASVLEPVLCMRRTILSLVSELVKQEVPSLVETLNNAVGQCWVKSAEAARKAGYYQQAYNYILKAEKFCPQKVFVEKAKLFWKKGEQESAFLTLRRGLEKYANPTDGTVSRLAHAQNRVNMLLNAEAKLLIATYNDKTLNVNMEALTKNYQEAVEVCPMWEKSLVSLAQHYDVVLSNMADREKDIKGGKLQVFMINLFGKSLQCGSVYLYQSMPRMLSIWLDYGTRLIEEGKKTNRESQMRRKFMTACLETMTCIIEKHVRNIPPYMFLTAFSQILSRICHPNQLVFTTLKRIVINILENYPQQALWMIMCVNKSTDNDRQLKCKEIFSDGRMLDMGDLISNFNLLAEMLIQLTNKKLPDKSSTAKISIILRQLPKLLSMPNFSQIIMPVEQFRNIILPPQTKTGEDLMHHNPLSKMMVYIHSVDDEVTILPSLQKPRKITFRGSDGKAYPIMCKPKDDLRRDFRLMEFNGIVNKYLLQDPLSRQRSLHIRTYSVVPLNEECGIIEWVPNLIGLRLILTKLYKDRSLYMSGNQYKEFMCENSDSTIKKKKMLVEKLLPRHPPVFGEWFRDTFTDPCSWYLARTSYIRTTAVMSMVGYIMGLGDRHGENILFDLTNGETVHVDFNCLFNKGEQFEWAERVPFRLTHNMVAAMGPFGVDGTFRRSCEITLSVMRSQIKTLMSVLRPFVYEPCVTYQSTSKAAANRLTKDNLGVEKTNDKAKESLADIESRLKGSISNGVTYSSPLSVEGQVDALILKATDINNLAEMYIGWASYM